MAERFASERISKMPDACLMCKEKARILVLVIPNRDHPGHRHCWLCDLCFYLFVDDPKFRTTIEFILEGTNN